MLPGRILGVDFSGARDAGRYLWLTEGELHGGRLTILRCRPALELPGGAAERPAALRALCALIAASAPCAVGFDFPFALHRTQAGARRWERFLRQFLGRYPAADALYRRTHRKPGPGAEPRRDTEVAARTPFAANNLRVYRQTFHGIRDVLRPLVAKGARVLPNQTPLAGRAWLLETCPASALKRLGLYAPYKGRGPGLRRARAKLLAALETRGIQPLAPALRRRVIAQPGGDALDSLIAAWITAQVVLAARNDPARLMPRLPRGREVEGWVYC